MHKNRSLTHHEMQRPREAVHRVLPLPGLHLRLAQQHVEVGSRAAPHSFLQGSYGLEKGKG